MKSNHIYIEELDKKIISFIRKHHILTLATAHQNIPYCCTCFYVYREKENDFIVTSDLHTRHVKELLTQPAVAGTIALETTMVGKIQGVQFTGTIAKITREEFNYIRLYYIKKFPVATLSKLVLWQIKPDLIKFTDNRLGLGKKMVWMAKNELALKYD